MTDRDSGSRPDAGADSGGPGDADSGGSGDAGADPGASGDAGVDSGGPDDLERAKRIQRLRSGEESGRSRRRRPRRERGEGADLATGGAAARSGGRPKANGTSPEANGTSPAEGGASGLAAAGESPDGADAAASADEDDGDDGTLRGDELLELATELPEEASLLVVPAREGLRRQLNRAVEGVHLRYGFQYGVELDAERHLRPLVLYLGVRALEDSDVEEVREVLTGTDVLESPDHEDGDDGVARDESPPGTASTSGEEGVDTGGEGVGAGEESISTGEESVGVGTDDDSSAGDDDGDETGNGPFAGVDEDDGEDGENDGEVSGTDGEVGGTDGEVGENDGVDLDEAGWTDGEDGWTDGEAGGTGDSEDDGAGEGFVFSEPETGETAGSPASGDDRSVDEKVDDLLADVGGDDAITEDDAIAGDDEDAATTDDAAATDDGTVEVAADGEPDDGDEDGSDLRELLGDVEELEDVEVDESTDGDW